MGQALESTRLMVEGALALADVTNGTFMSAQTLPCTENIRSINIIAVDIEGSRGSRPSHCRHRVSRN